MNSKLYRCGWCGLPVQQDGNMLDGTEKAIKIIEKYGDRKTHKVNGWCCPSGDGSQRVIVSREMALDAGDPSLEGQEINWG